MFVTSNTTSGVPGRGRKRSGEVLLRDASREDGGWSRKVWSSPRRTGQGAGQDWRPSGQAPLPLFSNSTMLQEKKISLPRDVAATRGLSLKIKGTS